MKTGPKIVGAVALGERLIKSWEAAKPSWCFPLQGTFSRRTVRCTCDGAEGRQSELSGVEAFCADDTRGDAVKQASRCGNCLVPGSWRCEMQQGRSAAGQGEIH
jgi:hypothetical protein